MVPKSSGTIESIIADFSDTTQINGEVAGAVLERMGTNGSHSVSGTVVNHCIRNSNIIAGRTIGITIVVCVLVGHLDVLVGRTGDVVLDTVFDKVIGAGA